MLLTRNAVFKSSNLSSRDGLLSDFNSDVSFYSTIRIAKGAGVVRDTILALSGIDSGTGLIQKTFSPGMDCLMLSPD
jgi:hypothetical protein